MVEGAHDCDKLMTTQLCCNFFQLQKQHVLCIDLNLQVSIFFVTSGLFLSDLYFKVSFYDLYVLIAIGFHFTGHDFLKLKTDATKTMTNLWSLLYDFSMTNLWSLIYDFLMTNLWSLLYDFFMTNLWSLIMWLAQFDDRRLVTRWTFLIDVQWSIFSFSVAKATLNNNLWHIYFSDAIICVQ